MELVLYSKDGCPFCSLLKMELAKRGFAFTEIDLSDDSIRAEFYAETGLSTVPQLFATEESYTVSRPSGKILGGWSEISKDWGVLENMG